MVIVSNAVPAAITLVDARMPSKFTAREILGEIDGSRNFANIALASSDNGKQERAVLAIR
jgi:hypothetical protein